MWLFRIIGEDETDIHGGGYRVRIMKFAKEQGVLGSVRNIKFKPEIEVRLIKENKEQAEKFKDDLKTKLKEPKLKFDDVCYFQDNDDNYKDFTVVREDELTEMVWALQGAGQIFSVLAEKQAELSEKQDKILKALNKRDYLKELGLLSALKLEVGFINEKVGDMIKQVAELGNTSFFNFTTSCLGKALVEPAWVDGNFMQLTGDLFYRIKRADKQPFDTLSKEAKLKELQELKSVAFEYKTTIDGRIKYLEEALNK